MATDGAAALARYRRSLGAFDDPYDAMKDVLDDVRRDGLSSSARQVYAAIDTRQAALDAGDAPATAMGKAIDYALSLNR